MSKNNTYLTIFLIAAGVIIIAALQLAKIPSMEIAKIDFSNIHIPKTKLKQSSPKHRRKAILSLDEPKIIAKQGEEIALKLKASTGSQEIVGIDVVLSYNPTILQFDRAEGMSGLNLIPSRNTGLNGKELRFSLISPPGQTIVGQINAANLYFKALTNGKTEVSFVFDGLAQLDDTEIVSVENKDILGDVKGSTVIIM